MARHLNELALDHIFWNLISTNQAFQTWFVAQTKFHDRDLILVRNEKWHQRWYRDPETGKDSETDILLVFADQVSQARYALHIENKPDHRKWTENQARNYRKRAINRMDKWRYVDFQTVLMAPQTFIDRCREEASEFDIVILYEDIRALAPSFGILASE